MEFPISDGLYASLSYRQPYQNTQVEETEQINDKAREPPIDPKAANRPEGRQQTRRPNLSSYKHYSSLFQSRSALLMFLRHASTSSNGILYRLSRYYSLNYTIALSFRHHILPYHMHVSSGDFPLWKSIFISCICK